MKTRSSRHPGVVLVCAATLAGAAAASAQQAAPDFGALLQGIFQQANQAEAKAAPELVNFRELKARLPAELPGMKRVSASGEKTGAFGINVATAEGTYRGEDGGTITIKITDTGGMGGLGAMAQLGFTASEVDRETETGYERTTKIRGHRALEKYDSELKAGSITMMAAKRLTFEIKGEGVPMEKVTAAVNKLDLDAIIKLLGDAGKEAAAPAEPAADKAK